MRNCIFSFKKREKVEYYLLFDKVVFKMKIFLEKNGLCFFINGIYWFIIFLRILG